MELNREQIIKALEYCVDKDGRGRLSPKCLECPFEGRMCIALDENALALIEEQQAKIEKYKNLAELRDQDNKDTCELLFKEEDKNKELQAQIKNLKKENKYLRERLKEEAELKEDMATIGGIK